MPNTYLYRSHTPIKVWDISISPGGSLMPTPGHSHCSEWRAFLILVQNGTQAFGPR